MNNGQDEMGEGIGGHGGLAAVMEPPALEEEQGSRFDMLIDQEDVDEGKSVEQLKREKEDMDRERRRQQQERVVADGGTPLDAAQSAFNESNKTKNEALHGIFKGNHYFSRAVATYQRQLENLPVVTRMADRLGRIVGYRSPVVVQLNERIALFQEAVASKYSPRLDDVVEEAGRLFSMETQSKIEKQAAQLDNISKRREKCCEDVESLRYAARENAFYLKDLEKKITGYKTDKAKLEKEKLRLARKVQEEENDADREALAVIESRIKGYNANISTAKSAQIQTTRDLQHYHAKVTQGEGELRDLEEREAQVQEQYLVINQNFEFFRSYLDGEHPDTDYATIFKTMSELSESNSVMEPALDALSKHSYEVSKITSDMKAKAFEPVGYDVNISASERMKQVTKDLVETYTMD